METTLGASARTEREYSVRASSLFFFFLFFWGGGHRGRDPIPESEQGGGKGMGRRRRGFSKEECRVFRWPLLQGRFIENRFMGEAMVHASWLILMCCYASQVVFIVHIFICVEGDRAYLFLGCSKVGNRLRSLMLVNSSLV